MLRIKTHIESQKSLSPLMDGAIFEACYAVE